MYVIYMLHICYIYVLYMFYICYIYMLYIYMLYIYIYIHVIDVSYIYIYKDMGIDRWYPFYTHISYHGSFTVKQHVILE